MKKVIYLLLFVLFTVSIYADKLELSYLEIKEIKIDHYHVLLKVPSQDKKKLSITVPLPKGCQLIRARITHRIKNTYLETWKMKCTQGLSEKTLRIQGLDKTKTTLLLRLDLLTQSHSILLTPSKPLYLIPKVQEDLEIVQTYTWLGITHILLGFDHLLFVFSLLMLVKSMRRLLWTITAFTLAHSLTMIVATLGIFTVPQAPVEAIIALSILFLAMEIIHEKQGKMGLTSRYPWLIAFIFGLLHGFGFAGALAEIGLPQQAIGLALLFFNIGVELGQLIFVSSIVVVILALRRLNMPKLLDMLQTLIIYIIGGVSSFWLIERTLSF